MESFLLQAVIYLGAAVLAVPLAQRLGLGSVLGYLIAGVMIGPMLGLVGSETQDLQHFAEFGVVMMLFIVGLELEPRALWGMRHRLVGLGGLQIVLTAAASTGFVYLLGYGWHVSVAIGMIVSLSSTAIVVQTLNEKDLMPTAGGRSAFSVLLAQDVSVIPLLALIPLLAMGGGGDGHGAAAHGSYSIMEGLSGVQVTFVTLISVGFVILAGVYLVRPVFHYIARSRLREMFTAIALFFVVGIAMLMILVGLSPALGTFLAGVVLANSEFRHELESNLEPFKGLLLGLFFITVGAGINFYTLLGDFFNILALVIGVMAIKGGVLYVLAWLFRIKGRNRWLFVLSLAQVGEFGFVMLSSALQNSVIPRELSESLALVIALSMLLTPLLFILYERITRDLTEQVETRAEDEIDAPASIIILGVGRFGQVVNRLALATGHKTVVIDHHIDQIDILRRFDVKGFFGDPTRPEMLRSAGLETAKILIVSMDDKKAAVKLVKYARSQRPDLHIIARAYDRNHVYELYSAGANDIVREVFDSSVRAGKYMLEQLGWSAYEINLATENFVTSDRAALADLARLWDPEIPLEKNKAYIERAKEIAQELNTQFLANLEEVLEQQKQKDKDIASGKVKADDSEPRV